MNKTDLCLPREYLPASGPALQDLVLLHGWGGDRELWRPLLARLRAWANVTLLDLPGCAPGIPVRDTPTPDELLEAILAAAPPCAVYLGWSLGGQLATLLAARHPDRASALATVCSNPRFVAGGDWPGMAGQDFSEFCARVNSDPCLGLRRFASLQVGGSGRPRELRRQLAREPVAGRPLRVGLDWLRQLDTRGELSALAQPQLHLYAATDDLVPAAVGPALRELLPSAERVTVSVLSAGSHALPLEAPDAVALALRDFLDHRGLLRAPLADERVVAKGDVADSFSRAARRYDSVAALQRHVGESLLAELNGVCDEPGAVLDLGCGTGYFQPALNRRFPGARYLGLDIARGMVEYARDRHPDGDAWLVADAELLPLASGSVDLVFSSLAVQWCYRPDLLFAELDRVLRPGAKCVFTTLGPRTLCELRSAWGEVDGYRHVNTFLPWETLKEAAGGLDGIRLELRGETFQMHYERVPELLRELKTLGAHNMNSGRPAGLTGPRALQAMFRAYEPFRSDGLLPATYDVIFGTLEKL